MIYPNQHLKRERWERVAIETAIGPALGAAIGLALGVALLGACQTGADPGDRSEEAPAPASGMLVAGPARELAPPASPEALAFRGDGGGFSAEHLTHRVTVREGVIDLTPRHFDAVSRRVVTGGALELATTGVYAGGERIDAGASAPVHAARAAVRITRGDVIEEITNRADGIEQVWHFAAQPAAGDLTVEVGVTGQRYVATTESGLHFESPAGLGFRYGHAVWRDANGAEYAVPVRYEGRIVITVPEDVVAASAFPAVLDPVVSAELYTDTPAQGATGANSRNADVASNGAAWFAVWQDQRDDRGDDIYGTRVGPDGAPGLNYAIDTSPGVQQNPVVAWVGSRYLVAWETVISTGNVDVAAALVTDPGSTVAPLGTVAGGGGAKSGVAIAGRGAQALLVWIEAGALRGAVFDGAAFGAPFDLVTGAPGLREPAVSANPRGDYLVSYVETLASGNDDVRGLLVTPAGAASGAPFTIAGGPGVQAQPASAFIGAEHIVVWTSASNVFGARVSATGVVLDPTPVTINAGASSQILPDIGCTATACFVAWQDSRNAPTSVRDVYGALISPALAVVANDIVISGAARAQDAPAVAPLANGWYVAWGDHRVLEYIEIRGSRIAAGTGVVQDADGAVLARGARRYQAPAIAQTPLHTSVFMSAGALPDVDLMFTRYTGAGAQVGGGTVSSAPGAQVAPAAAFVGTNSLVVWSDTRGADRDIYAARVAVNSGAVVLDPMGIPVSTAPADQFVPRIASAGSSALIVWQDRRNGSASGFDIYGAVISETGAVTVNDLAICTGAGDQGGPAVAYDSANGVYLVVWTHPTDPTGASTDIRGARVSAAGALLDADCGVAISDAAGSQFRADVTHGNGRFMVVWEDRRNDTTLGDIYGARVTAAGALAVQDPAGLPISVISGSAQRFPTVAFGTGYSGSYLVAWADERNEAVTGSDIYGAQVSVMTGAATTPFPISATTDDEDAPDLAPGTGQNPFNVAYLKHNAAASTMQMQFRRISLGTVGGQPCTQNSQCETGFCSDGRCCDSACGGSVTNDCQACSVARGAIADGTCTVVPASLQLICRDYAVRTDSRQCDIREYCDGASPLCPADLGQNAGAACVTAGGVVGTCPAADATGAPHLCQ